MLRNVENLSGLENCEGKILGRHRVNEIIIRRQRVNEIVIRRQRVN
jgi:hypothetical protein